MTMYSPGQIRKIKDERDDLLEALRDLASYCEMQKEFNDPRHGSYYSLFDAREAIKKAEGKE